MCKPLNAEELPKWLKRGRAFRIINMKTGLDEIMVLQKFEMDNKKEKYFLSFSRNKKCLEGKNSLFMVVKGTKMEFNHLNDDNMVFETLNVKGTKKNRHVKKNHSKTKKR